MINTRFLLSCIFSIFSLFSQCCVIHAQNEKRYFRVMEYNVENLFDCDHDTLKNDLEFSPEGAYKWTKSKYWKKLNAVARGIVLASTENNVMHLPDLIGLCEVENDSVLHSLTKRSLLRGAGYEYVMTQSLDERGIDVALMYQPVAFRLVSHYPLRIDSVPGMRRTRDILYVKGETMAGMLHAFVVHAPSRRGGERETRPFRMAAIKRLTESVDSINMIEPDARILVMGDFNAYTNDKSLEMLAHLGLEDVSSAPYLTEDNSIKGTYRYQGEWGSLDHVFLSKSLLKAYESSFIGHHPELVEPDEKYGGVKPRRFFRGPISRDGYSDHLPIVVDFVF